MTPNFSATLPSFSHALLFLLLSLSARFPLCLFLLRRRFTTLIFRRLFPRCKRADAPKCLEVIIGRRSLRAASTASPFRFSSRCFIARAYVCLEIILVPRTRVGGRPPSGHTYAFHLLFSSRTWGNDERVEKTTTTRTETTTGTRGRRRAGRTAVAAAAAAVACKLFSEGGCGP